MRHHVGHKLCPMYSDPVIVSSPDLSYRSYVKVYVDGKRYRIYNGKSLGLLCNPNHCASLTAREKALRYLSYQLKVKLGQGWKPSDEEVSTQPGRMLVPSAADAFNVIRQELNREHLSTVYERDMLSLSKHFLSFLERRNLDQAPITSVETDVIAQFLLPFKTSATNYMNRRRTLSALFSRLVVKKLIVSNPVQETGKLKQSVFLNLPYKKQQLRDVLQVVKEQHEPLYLCCLLMYGCLLRPHQEIRLLTRGSFNESFDGISLGGSQNKSRRIRSVHIPGYVHDELIKQGVDQLPDERNIFSRSSSPFNMSYFNTAWSRIKEDLMERKVISQHHTLYSFRHTAAVNMYLKTKDPYKIQQAFAHSSLRVTLLYLRSLGLVVDSSLEDLPDL